MSGEIIFIRENATGVVREMLANGLWFTEDPDTADYMWSEGNYACDCNRSLFFARANGEEDPADPRCGDAAYSVRVVASDGVELYADGDWLIPNDSNK